MKHRSKLISILIVILALSAIALCATPVFAETRTVKVGLFPHHPFIFSQEGIPQGFYVDLIQEIGRKHDWDVEFISGSWADGLHRLQNQEIDLVTSIAYTEERAKKFDYTKESNISLWGQVYASEGSTIKNILDLSNKKVAVLKNGISGKKLIALTKEFNIDVSFIECPNFNDVFDKIANGEVDAGVSTNTFGYSNEKEFGVSRTPIIFNPFSLYFAVAKGKNNDIIQVLDTEIAAQKADKDSLYHKRLDFWFARGSKEHTLIPKWAYYLGAILFSVAIVGVTLSGLLRKKVLSATVSLRNTNQKLLTSIKEKEEARKLLDLHVTNTPLAAIEWDTEQRVTSWNPSAERVFGYSREEAIGKHASFIVFDISREEIDYIFKQLHAKTGGTRNINKNITKDGATITCQWFNTPLIDQNGTAYGVASLTEDITEKVEAENQLKQLNQQISGKNEELEQIIYAASHDLRSPLVNIQGYSKEVLLLLNDLKTTLSSCNLDLNTSKEIELLIATEIPEAFKFIQSSALKMDTLLNGLLKLSRAGRASLHIQKLDVNTLLRQILDSFDYQITLNNIKVEVDTLPDCLADELQLTHAFSNLISNALKYLSPERDGCIYISGSVNTKGEIEYSIGDNGIGIAQEHQKKVFDIFHRLNHTEEGEGIGLTIVQRVLERLNGRISLRSKENEGSCFTITLPAPLTS